MLHVFCLKRGSSKKYRGGLHCVVVVSICGEAETASKGKYLSVSKRQLQMQYLKQCEVDRQPVLGSFQESFNSMRLPMYFTFFISLQRQPPHASSNLAWKIFCYQNSERIMSPCTCISPEVPKGYKRLWFELYDKKHSQLKAYAQHTYCS